MESFSLSYRIAAPPSAVFAELADPSYIERIAPFRVTVTHVRDGRDHKHGVGSIRRIQPWFGPAYEEEILVFSPPSRMEYTTIRGVPFDHHHGVYLTDHDPSSPGHTRFRFHLEFSTRVPLLARLIKLPLEPINRLGFDRFARHLNATSETP